MDKQSAKVKPRVPARLSLSKRKVGQVASAKPMPMSMSISSNLRPRPSRGAPTGSGVDSKEEDDDSRV